MFNGRNISAAFVFSLSFKIILHLTAHGKHSTFFYIYKSISEKMQEKFFDTFPIESSIGSLQSAAGAERISGSAVQVEQLQRRKDKRATKKNKNFFMTA